MVTLEAGAKVRTASTVRPPRYADKTGKVVEVRHLEGGAVEVGVKIGAGISWFTPAELEALR